MTDDGPVVRLDAVSVTQLPAATTEELVALAQATLLLRDRGDEISARALEGLGLALRAKLRIGGQRLREADVEALLEGRHLLARPGPRPTLPSEVFGPLSEALLALRRVAFAYTRSSGGTVRHEVEPWGLITSVRTYLVARLAGRFGDPTRLRLDRMSNVVVLDSGYSIPEDFDLSAYARRSFGSFDSLAEYGDVVWRFAPRAAQAAAGFDFHPDQTAEWTADGSLIVRFRAAGLLEMAWFLYQWGDAVEVIEPTTLREMIEHHRRSDFPALP
jgi:predicted DNA-binding transcriptional regulator YafY